MKVIPYGRQYIDTNDKKLVSKSLNQQLITTGNYVKKFEKRICEFLKVKYSLSCTNGTSAIHLAFMAVNLKKGDTIIMPAINFISAFNMASQLKANIVLADVDPLTGQMTPKTLIAAIKKNKIKKIKIILTMYLGGYPENVENFYKIKKKYNCILIEDSCHALGAKYLFKKKYIPIGACKHSDISTFSLHPVKTITSGEGGLITTNNKLIYNRILHLRSHGMYRNNNLHWKYDIRDVSYNYRLSDLNCALGLSQLKKIRSFINYRKKIFNFYRLSFKKYKQVFNFPDYNNNLPSYHLSLILVNFKKLKINKDKFLKLLKKNNIFCQYHYIPIYRFHVFKKKLNLNSYKGSENYFQKCVSLPIFYNLPINSVKKVINTILSIIKKNYS